MSSKFKNDRPATFVLPADVHAQLKEWATQNRTSMRAEFIRATRERAARERQSEARAA